MRRWFVSDRAALDAVVRGAGLRACAHCHRAGRLIGHGLLFGYAERSSAREVRGRRLFCTNRHRRGGCGRTIAVWLGAVLPSRIVRAATAFSFFVALALGTPAAPAWRAVSAMSVRTGHRIRDALAAAGPSMRTALSSRAPPPPVASSAPVAQLVAHYRAVLGPEESFAAYQVAFQRSLFG